LGGRRTWDKTFEGQSRVGVEPKRGGGKEMKGQVKEVKGALGTLQKSKEQPAFEKKKHTKGGGKGKDGRV